MMARGFGGGDEIARLFTKMVRRAPSPPWWERKQNQWLGRRPNVRFCKRGGQVLACETSPSPRLGARRIALFRNSRAAVEQEPRHNAPVG